MIFQASKFHVFDAILLSLFMTTTFLRVWRTDGATDGLRDGRIETLIYRHAKTPLQIPRVLSPSASLVGLGESAPLRQKNPASHSSVGVVAFGAWQANPAGHGRQPSTASSPSSRPKVPGGQGGRKAPVPAGQKNPRGHLSGVMVPLPAQKDLRGRVEEVILW